MAQKDKVLSLYRSILRTGRQWSGPNEEQKYILEEAKAQFRAHRDSKEADQRNLLAAGQQRLEYATHYGIPYPRQHHASQFYKRQYLDSPSFASDAEAGESAAQGAGSADAASKLAAALARRKKREGK
ncbi:hypothetical protein WJX73_007901 [Symbiochloris irregularis]|uniref:Complex 1 LYR protein domain-containing protein n=1 Tax=Symbiochloris irregularis TaxID=706552 RepID=A0AAW1PX27_9CHLO